LPLFGAGNILNAKGLLWHGEILVSQLRIDFTSVPYVDSAGIGALVGAYVTREKDGRSLYLVGVSDRIHSALQVTRVDHFFRFFNTMAEVENAA